MVASPTLAIDLPLKALVWEDAEGKVWLSYNSPDYLKQRHGFPDALIPNIAGAGAISKKLFGSVLRNCLHKLKQMAQRAKMLAMQSVDDAKVQAAQRALSY